MRLPSSHRSGADVTGPVVSLADTFGARVTESFLFLCLCWGFFLAPFIPVFVRFVMEMSKRACLLSAARRRKQTPSAAQTKNSGGRRGIPAASGFRMGKDGPGGAEKTPC